MKKVVKRKKKNNRKWFVLTGIDILLVFVIAGILLFTKNPFEFHSPDTLIALSQLEVNIPKPEHRELSLLMVGDALIHGSVYKDAYQNGTYDFRPMLSLVKPITESFDLAYYNQETILGGTELGLSSYPRFNSPYEVGDAFLDAGFDLTSLATNHTLDKGEQGVLNSFAYWHDKNMITAGQYSSLEDRNQKRIYEKNGIKFAFFSYTTVTNGLLPPSGKEYLTNIYSYEKAKKDIEQVKDEVDFIIVAAHWGTEYTLKETTSQRQMAQELADLGVNLIIGTHPHVIEPVEYLNDGKTFVIYSLGNFISDQVGQDRLTGLMMAVTLSSTTYPDGNKENVVTNPKAELLYTKSTKGEKRNFKVYPYRNLDDTVLENYQETLQKYKSVVETYVKDIVWQVS